MNKKRSIEIPFVDDREYRFFVLENDMKCLVVHDPCESVKAGAAMNVLCGHFDEPNESLGISHFLEHCLFMGSSKFGEDIYFEEFIGNNAGYHNAESDDETTMYYYEINSTKLERSIEIFAEYFITPSFNSESVKEEVKCVHSEYKKAMKSSSAREKMLLKSSCNPNHPWSRFSYGNENTLGKGDVVENVRQFYKKNYSAELMYLVVHGHENLDELQKMVKKYFSKVPKRSGVKKVKEYPMTLFNPSLHQYKIFNVIPIGERRYVKVLFPLTLYYRDYRNNMLEFLGYLFGHESKGSVYYHLKEKGLITSLSAGMFHEFNGSCWWGIGMSKTEEGEKRLLEIITSVFQYIKMLQSLKEHELKNLFMERKEMKEIAFMYRDKTDTDSYVRELSSNMPLFGTEHVISGLIKYFNFDMDEFKRIMKFLNVSNMMIMNISKSFRDVEYKDKQWKEEEFFKVKYFTSQILKNQISDMKNCKRIEEFHPPEKNPFVSKNLVIIPKEKNDKDVFPKKIYESGKISAFFNHSVKYNTPKGCARFFIRFNKVRESIKTTLMHNLLGTLITDSLNDYSYLAEVAGTSLSVFGDEYGFYITVIGYSDSITRVLLKAIDRMLNLRIRKDRFQVLLKKKERKWKNTRVRNPIDLAKGLMYCILTSELFHPEDVMKMYKSVSYEDIVKFHKEVMKSLKVTALFVGNHVQNEILKVIKEVEILFSKSRSMIEREFPPIRKVKMQRKSLNVLQIRSQNKDDMNCGLLLYYQLGLRSDYKDVMIDLTYQLIQSKFFEQLRTVEQLGYITSSGVVRSYWRSNNTQYYQFHIASGTKDPNYLYSRIISFLNSFYNDLKKNLTDEEVEDQVETLKDDWNEDFHNLRRESSFFFNEILRGQYRFGRYKDVASKLSEMDISKESYLNFFKKYFIEEKAVMAIQVFPMKDSEKLVGKMLLEDKGVEITNWVGYDSIYKFRKENGTFPAFHDY